MNNYILPDGSKFIGWSDSTKYSVIYHVAQNHPNASDENDGSADKPFLTIGKAAEIAVKGNLVIIHEGIYREKVSPANSGEADDAMICFKGAEGEKVVVTGAEVYKGGYNKSVGWVCNRININESSQNKADEFNDPYAKVYMAKLPASAFIGTNPFSMVNGPLIAWFDAETAAGLNYAKEDAQKKIIMMKRGIIFCDGVRIEQVVNYFELGEKAGRFFVEDDGLTVHLRLPDDSDPASRLIEYTAREQCFCPENKFSSYIKIEGVTFNKAGNPLPPPQRGAVSVYFGHHFIISRCTVEDVNGVGIDIGFQCPNRYSDALRGYHIVTGCTIDRCGMCGIAGVPGSTAAGYLNTQHSGLLIINNELHDNCWHDFEYSYESASIKIHHLNNSLIMQNCICRTNHGAGIYTDASCTNMAIRENVVLNSKSMITAILVEASYDDISVADNIIVNSAAHGIFSSYSDNISSSRNIILGCQKSGICHNYKQSSRISMGRRGSTGRGMKYYGNIISHCRQAIVQPNEHGDSNRNIFGYFYSDGYLTVSFPEMHLDITAWRKYFGWDKECILADMSYTLKEDDTVLSLEISIDKMKILTDLKLNLPVREQLDDLFNKLGV